MTMEQMQPSSKQGKAKEGQKHNKAGKPTSEGNLPERKMSSESNQSDARFEKKEDEAQQVEEEVVSLSEEVKVVKKERKQQEDAWTEVKKRRNTKEEEKKEGGQTVKSKTGGKGGRGGRGKGGRKEEMPPRYQGRTSWEGNRNQVASRPPSYQGRTSDPSQNVEKVERADVWGQKSTNSPPGFIPVNPIYSSGDLSPEMFPPLTGGSIPSPPVAKSSSPPMPPPSPLEPGASNMSPPSPFQEPELKNNKQTEQFAPADQQPPSQPFDPASQQPNRQQPNHQQPANQPFPPTNCPPPFPPHMFSQPPPPLHYQPFIPPQTSSFIPHQTNSFIPHQTNSFIPSPPSGLPQANSSSLPQTTQTFDSFLLPHHSELDAHLHMPPNAVTMQEIEEGFMRMHNNNQEEEQLEDDHDLDWDTKDGRTARRMQNSENALGNHSELVKWLSRFLAIKH